jgi:hypothetical protein
MPSILDVEEGDRRTHCWFCGSTRVAWVVTGPAVFPYVICDSPACIDAANPEAHTLTPLAQEPPLTEFKAVLAEVLALHEKKNADYGSAEDPYANVTDSEQWGVSPWIGASVRLSDKERRLKLYAQTGNLSNESAEDSLLDNIVYNIIRLILWRREQRA